MTEEAAGVSPPSPPQPRWQPLGAIDRRVLGVLAEKAKTTPDIYPMSLNAICTGCNQKSNRSPLMQLEPSEIEESLDRLRELRAVGLIEGYGRVAKYRHYLYEWLGVDKVEMAVMTELLLRGDQTVGDLRGRAARMEPIPDLARSEAGAGLAQGEGIGGLADAGRSRTRPDTCVVQAPRIGKPQSQVSSQWGGRVGWWRRISRDDGDAPRHSAPGGNSGAGDAPGRRYGGRRSHHDPPRFGRTSRQMAQMRAELDDVRSTQHNISDEVRTLKDALGG